MPVRGRKFARKSGVGIDWNATGGSAVPLVRRTYDRSGHRADELTALSGQGKGRVCRWLKASRPARPERRDRPPAIGPASSAALAWAAPSAAWDAAPNP